MGTAVATQDATLRKQGGNWDPEQNEWQLYNLETDFTQSEDLSAQHPDRTKKMSELFMSEAKANKVFPIGGSIWLQLHPEDRIATPYTEWEFDRSTRRMPEFTAPGLRRSLSLLTVKNMRR